MYIHLYKIYKHIYIYTYIYNIYTHIYVFIRMYECTCAYI